MAGSILAYFEINNGHRSKNRILNLILPFIGLVLIGHSILFFNDEMFHPSFYTLSPIIGVCLIIWFSNKNEITTKIISTKLFVGVGLISYSLYLWHYPIFAFARITDFTQGSLSKELLLATIIIIVSIFSYYFIERPARNKNNKFKFIISLILISISVLVFVNINIIHKNGYKDRLPKIFPKNLSGEPPWILLKNLDGKKCYNNIEGCKFNTSSNKKVYIIGDSHMASLMFNLKDRLVKKNYQFITYSFGNCLFYPGFNLVKTKTNKADEICNDYYFQKLKKILSKESNSIIIFGGRFPLYISNYFFDNQEGGIEGKEYHNKYVSVGKYNTIQSSFKNEISELSIHNKIIIIYPIPEVGWNPERKIYNQWIKQRFNKNFNIKNITTSFEVYKDRAKSSFELLDSIQSRNIFKVYPHTLFCDTIIKERCVTHDDENMFYADNNHPSLKGVEMINDLVMKEIEKIELKSN